VKITLIKRALLHGAGAANENKLSEAISGQRGDSWDAGIRIGLKTQSPLDSIFYFLYLEIYIFVQ
jgi:hypothetical protein